MEPGSSRKGDVDHVFREARRVEAEKAAASERSASRFGMALMALGGVTVAAPIILNGTITVIPALAGLAIAILGGLVRDPKTFKGIATRVIDKLPGGKK